MSKLYSNDPIFHIQILEWATKRFIETIIGTPMQVNQYKKYWIHYTRLTGNQNPQALSKLSPIEQMIDKNTGLTFNAMIKLGIVPQELNKS